MPAASELAPAMVCNQYTNPDSRFGIRDNPYSKGMFVLHMLRERLGDEAFFTGVRAYIAKGKASGLVETADLRRALETASGTSLERFFEQWTHRPGIPRLKVQASWIDSQKSLVVEVEQLQPVNRLNPAYALTIPVLVRFADDTEQWHEIVFDTVSTREVFALPAAPKVVELDPKTTLLASIAPRAIDPITGGALPSWETREDREFAVPPPAAAAPVPVEGSTIPSVPSAQAPPTTPSGRTP